MLFEQHRLRFLNYLNIRFAVMVFKKNVEEYMSEVQTLLSLMTEFSRSKSLRVCFKRVILAIYKK